MICRAMRGALGGIIRRAELRAPQHDAGVGHAGQPGLEVPVLAQEIHRHAMFPAQVQRRRADGAGSEHADGFQVMDRDGKLAPVRGLLPRPLFRRQLGRINGNLGEQRQMIPADVTAPRGEVKGVLLDVHTSCNFKFEISNLRCKSGRAPRLLCAWDARLEAAAAVPVRTPPRASSARLRWRVFSVQMSLALDVGVLQRVGPAAQLAGARFGDGFQICNLRFQIRRPAGLAGAALLQGEHGPHFARRPARDVNESRAVHWCVPRSKPSAMLLDTDRAARSSWSRKPRVALKARFPAGLLGEFVKFRGFLPHGQVFESFVGHGRLVEG